MLQFAEPAIGAETFCVSLSQMGDLGSCLPQSNVQITERKVWLNRVQGQGSLCGLLYEGRKITGIKIYRNK